MTNQDPRYDAHESEVFALVDGAGEPGYDIGYMTHGQFMIASSMISRGILLIRSDGKGAVRLQRRKSLKM